MKIVWEFLTSDEIKRRAVCMVEHDIRGGLLSEEDSKGTLADRRMGPALRTETCQTCFKKYDYCEGHFGAIPLAVPIIPFFLINEVKKRIKKPEGCNKISYNKDNGFLLTFKDKTEKYVSANDLLHPGNGIQTTSSLDRFIFSYLLVVPLCIRPYLKYNNGADVAAHPLTTLYKRIVVANNALRDSLHLPAFVVKNKTIALMDAVNCLFDSSKAASSSETSTATPHQGIKQLLSSKTGIIRLSVMGARVNFTARTVITADPTLKINQIGLPIHFSEVLTIPVVVTEANIQQIKSTTRLEEEYVRYVSKDQKQQYLLQYTPRDKLVQFLLQVGGTLHRKIKNGDCVVVNRQPSLHKASMMSFYVVLMKDMTLRLPMSVCKAFNADFDGDEMNIHVPQTIQARAEALTLLSVDENLISAQTGMPLIGLIYDALFGIYEMSADHVRVSRELLGDIYCWLESEGEEGEEDDEEPIPKKKVNTTTTGKQVLSLAFPRDFDYEKENDVSIRCGILIKGRLCKSNISLILYALYIRYDARTVRGFLNKIQFIVNAWLATQGFSASIMDGQPSRSAPPRRVVDEVAFQALQTETERLAFLNKIQDVPLPPPTTTTNGFLRIITAGSKGTSSNYNQMVHCVGQQMLSGQRLLKQSLSHVIEPNTALGGGFVSSSFFQGLNPLESFLHAMAGRQGIVNTCITTAVSGYLTRKFVKTLENVRVLYDGTVRKSNHQIIQFKYSGDGLKPEYVKSFSKMGMEMIKQKATQEECTYTLPSEQRTTMEELIRSHYENEWFRDVLQQHGGETLEFFSHFQQHLQRALIEPGTNVGVIAAQSISEPTTQMTLNSFHFASSAVKGGLPQLIELTHLSEKQTLLLFEEKNTPNVPLIEPFEELFEFFVFSRAQKPAWETWEWCYLGSFLPFETVMEERPSVWVELRQKKYIEDALFVPIVCALRKLLQQEGGDGGGLITHSNYREELFEVRVYCETYDAALSMIKKIKRAKVTAMEEAIHAKRVGASSFELLGNDWENVASFRKMLASFPETVTNSPILMLHTFGVEATCEFMAKQMEDIVGKSADVLYRHFELLVDTMCYSGVPVSIKTTEQDDVSPISKASFEKVLSAFVEGALNNHVDCVETVASKVAIGSRLDADLMDVFLDYEKNEQAMQQLKKDQATRVLLEREEQEYLNMQQIIDFL